MATSASSWAVLLLIVASAAVPSASSFEIGRGVADPFACWKAILLLRHCVPNVAVPAALNVHVNLPPACCAALYQIGAKCHPAVEYLADLSYAPKVTSVITVICGHDYAHVPKPAPVKNGIKCVRRRQTFPSLFPRFEELSVMAGKEMGVEITVKTVGPSRPKLLRVPADIKVRDLKRSVASECCLPVERLKLVLHGKVLHERKNADSEHGRLRLENGDTLIVAVMPKPPAKHLREDEEEEEDDLKVHIPRSASWWKKKLIYILQEKLRLPDVVLIAIFSISLKAWACVILWFLLAPVAHKWDFGPLYILGTGFLVILLNLGKRQHGELSAYSIFNEDFRELPGTLNADRLDHDIRAGQF
ncbi:hypothetical protein HPP92_028475 [Vanilla planifolia]|uniref:Ubiquitin-like domain-containing protein n=1 Tax=Vanilla planifolia TaxID=51239 RepID=A0A835P623_VANPL|nr:hypothetical protein HPP92_028475 [Vanilla planifolia]